MEQVGEALGCEIKIILLSLKNKDGGKRIHRNSRFCCPLDEALVECNLTACSDVMGKGKGNFEVYTLAPYRSFPKTGRIRIGRMLTSLVETFFRALYPTQPQRSHSTTLILLYPTHPTLLRPSESIPSNIETRTKITNMFKNKNTLSNYIDSIY